MGRRMIKIQNFDLKFRILFISFLVIIIIFSLFYKKSKTIDLKKIEALNNKKVNLVYKIFYFQILISMELPQENQKVIKEQILNQIEILSNEVGNYLEAKIQNYIIYNHFQEQEKRKTIEIEDQKYKEFINILNDIYVYKKKDIKLDSELFLLPLGKIAILDYYKYSNEKEFKNYYQKLMKEILPLQIVFIVFPIIMFSSIALGIFILIKFFSKTPQNFFGNFIRSLSFQKIWIMLEASVIYLFFMIPVQFILSMIFSLEEKEYLLFLIFYTIIVFIFILYYLKAELGTDFLKNLFMFRVYTYQKENFLEDLIHKESDQELDEKNIFTKMENLISEKKLKPLSPFQEIFYGFVGFIVIFPISMLVLFFSIFITGSEVKLEDAHPISFIISENFWEVFILATILAPITEEFIFRNLVFGVFRYRFSIFLSGILSGILFASLHPQGYIAFPYLIFLGMSLAFLREFRPGIIAPMITHFFVNFLAISMNYLIYTKL